MAYFWRFWDIDFFSQGVMIGSKERIIMNIAIRVPHIVEPNKDRRRIVIHGPNDWKHARRMFFQGTILLVSVVMTVGIGLTISIQHTLGVGFFRAVYIALNGMNDGFSL